jgi:transposase-like protein
MQLSADLSTMEQEIEMMILCCPVCQSTEVYEVAGGYVGQVYRCKKCGYRGSFVLEIDEKDLLEHESEAGAAGGSDNKIT